MKICLVHNAYGKISGEEVVVQGLQNLLEEKGHEVISFFRSSAEIPKMPLGIFRAFFSGIYNPSSANIMKSFLKKHQPDVVHIHNVFPLISPSVLPVCKKAGVPVIMTVHNYRLICPNGLFMTHGKICEKCSGGREYWCVFNNCERNHIKSFGYALRNFIARKQKFFIDNVSYYTVMTKFQKQKLIKQGFSSDKIFILPHKVTLNYHKKENFIGDYIGYAGRISPEKGILTLLEAARRLKHISFKAAGNYDNMLQVLNQATKNFDFLGHITPNHLKQFYHFSRIIILCSICYETFGLTIAEAMMHGKPVICSRIGGVSEIVEEGITGLLFEPGNAKDLAEKIQYLWERPELCRQMGQAGQKKVLREYSAQTYYNRLMTIYEKAISIRN